MELVRHGAWAVGDETLADCVEVWGPQHVWGNPVILHTDSINIHAFNSGEEPLGEVLAGPFETIEAAKTAYLVLYG